MMSRAKGSRQLLFEHIRVLAWLSSGYLKSQNDRMNKEWYDFPHKTVSQKIWIIFHA